MTLVAIITPVYVSPEFPSRLALFDKTVASVNKLGSDETAHLHIVVDDGSTDPDGIQRVLEKCNDPRIRYLRRERKETDLKTASNALNFGIDAVLEGHPQIPEYRDISAVTPLHSDDLMYDVTSRVKALQRDEVGAAISSIAIFEDGVKKIQEPDFTMRARHYVERGIAPYPVQSLMWTPRTLAGMKQINQEVLPADQRFEGVYRPDFVNVEDVLVAKLTAFYLYRASLRIGVSEAVSMAYHYHLDSLRGYHQDVRRGKTDQDLWNSNPRLMVKMYYELVLWRHVSP